MSLPAGAVCGKPAQPSCCSSSSAAANKPVPATAASSSATSSSLPSSSSSSTSSRSDIYEAVQRYYGIVLSRSSDLQTNACCSGPPPPHLSSYLKRVPAPILDTYYGCGYPLPAFLQDSGLTVLDLGSGSGRDCYVAAAMVGEKGNVIGVDMTDKQLHIARQHVDTYCSATLGYSKPNLTFKHGYIEFLTDAGIAPASIDLVISNCVVNLSPNKLAVLQSVFSVLREGGEFYFSDVYADRRIPQSLREDEAMYGECLSGALYWQDFIRLCAAVGFADVRVVSRSRITVDNAEAQRLVGNINFESITVRLFKFSNKQQEQVEAGKAADASGSEAAAASSLYVSSVPSLSRLETLCEDYGQFAIYQGTIPSSPHSYALDDHHTFITGKPMLVCSNTAMMVGESVTLGKHFVVGGNTNTHYGVFDCSGGGGGGGGVDAGGAAAKRAAAAGSCC